MRVTLYLRCRGVPSAAVELVSTGMETDHRGICHFLAGQAPDEAPMADDQHMGPILDLGHVILKASAALVELVLGFGGLGPPTFREVAEGEARPALGQDRTR